MNNNSASTESASSVIDLIRQIVREEISKNNSKMELQYDGLVTEIDTNSLVSVNLDYITLTGLFNRTGGTLTVGDAVRVYAVQNNLSDAYVGVKIR